MALNPASSKLERFILPAWSQSRASGFKPVFTEPLPGKRDNNMYYACFQGKSTQSFSKNNICESASERAYKTQWITSYEVFRSYSPPKFTTEVRKKQAKTSLTLVQTDVIESRRHWRECDWEKQRLPFMTCSLSHLCIVLSVGLHPH